MSTRLQGINNCLAAGAIAGLVTTILIWLVGRLGIFAIIGVPLAPDLSNIWIYQRMVWGGLWGFQFLIPVMRGMPHWKRGLVFGTIPALASLFFFLPFKDGQGMLGLEMGPLMPVVVIVFNLLWGYLAGRWLDFTEGRG